jgi:hypothetical protein
VLRGWRKITKAGEAWKLILKEARDLRGQWRDKEFLEADRPEDRTCGRFLAGNAASNLSGSMDVCLLTELYCQVEVFATGRSLVQKNPTDIRYYSQS